MDLLTQGLLGAAAGQALLGRQLGHRAWIIGAVGGFLPDADGLINSQSDPLLNIQFHRGFTHSLAFIPFGGAIAALPFLLSRRNRSDGKYVLAAAVAGNATHGLLDACTTYGTQLFWPFSDYRVAWNNVSIIDPIFTLALIVGIIIGARSKSQRPAFIALILCILYLIIGAVQRDRAMAVQETVAASRGHVRSRGEVFPTLGNHLVWRSLYQSGDTFHADRIRVPWIGTKTWAPGTSVAAIDEADLPDSIRSNTRLLDDFRRFHWFSSGWIARPPDDSSVIGDVRYSLRTEAFEPIWGIRFHPDEPIPIEWVDRTRRRELGVGELWEEITGTRGDYREAP